MTLQKFKYTSRKNGDLYVRLYLKGLKNPIWRLCRDETQEGVNLVISQIKKQYAIITGEIEAPQNFESFSEFWLELVRGKIEQATFEHYSTMVRKHLIPAFGELVMTEILPINFQQFFQRLSKERSHRTVSAVYTVARMVMKQAVELEVIKRNPVPQISRPKKYTESKADKAMSASDARKFLSVCKDVLRYGLVLEFALETGMRPSEYLAIRWQDIDLAKKQVTVNRAVVFNGKTATFKVPKTKYGRRTISISDELAEKLSKHREDLAEQIRSIKDRINEHLKPSRENTRKHRQQVFLNAQKCDLVFPSQTFSVIEDKNLYQRGMVPALKAAGIAEHYTLYSLRHTSITWLLASGEPIKNVSYRAGHSSVAFTLDTYAHILDGMDSDAPNKLRDIFK